MKKKAQRIQWHATHYTAKMKWPPISRRPSLFLPQDLWPNYSLCLEFSSRKLASCHSTFIPNAATSEECPLTPSLKSPSPTPSTTLPQESLNYIPQSKSAHHGCRCFVGRVLLEHGHVHSLTYSRGE